MTNEQIKQNAEAYAKKHEKVLHYYHGEEPETDFEDKKNAYIAGTHSRDKEIEELKEEIESLKENEKELFEGFKKRGTKLGKLMKENIKLHNPWISIEDRLPEIEDEKEKRTGEVFVCIKDGVYLVAHYSYFYKAWYAFDDRGGCMYRKIRTPRYWMPIPELKKGGEK